MTQFCLNFHSFTSLFVKIIQITKFGEPICEFGSPLKKQPFERLFIACPAEMSRTINIPAENFIYSVPSAIHSHKPPLEGRIQCQNDCFYSIFKF